MVCEFAQIILVCIVLVRNYGDISSASVYSPAISEINIADRSFHYTRTDRTSKSMRKKNIPTLRRNPHNGF